MNIDYLDNKKNELDDLTQVFERQVITSYMDYLISKNIKFGFAILDIDNFKFVNDNYGHLVGDEVLKVVAKSIESVSKEFGVVGRYGGDEFIFVFPEISEYDEIWQCGFKLIKSAIDLKIPQAKDINISYTLGMSRFPTDSTNIDELMELADKALYRGKMKGRNCFIIYLPEKHKNIDIMNKRDKVYSPLYLNRKAYNMLIGNNNIDVAFKDTIAFVGSTLMIDHICVEADDELKYDYYHPLSKKFSGYEPIGADVIETKTDSNGLYYENVTENHFKENSELYKKFKEQSIYAAFIVRISVYGRNYGYLRAEMVNVNTGRIWQQSDLVMLVNLANLMGLILYSKDEK